MMAWPPGRKRCLYRFAACAGIACRAGNGGLSSLPFDCVRAFEGSKISRSFLPPCLHSPGGGDFWTEFAVAIGYSELAMMGLQFDLTARFRYVTEPWVGMSFTTYIGRSR